MGAYRDRGVCSGGPSSSVTRVGGGHWLYKLGFRLYVERLGVAGSVAGERDTSLSGCLRRVNHRRLVSISSRIGLTRHVHGNSHITLRGLIQTGLHFMISITGRCRGRNLSLPSLVGRNGINLVGTTRGFSRAHNFGFVSCTM